MNRLTCCVGKQRYGIFHSKTRRLAKKIIKTVYHDMHKQILSWVVIFDKWKEFALLANHQWFYTISVHFYFFVSHFVNFESVLTSPSDTKAIFHSSQDSGSKSTTIRHSCPWFYHMPLWKVFLALPMCSISQTTPM